ncbi:2-polyprenyl-3-methyl-5-hydroxy-6-metoxy-1,4-benzoquinol methylase [Paenibacillus sp. PvP094]|uniref:class I SAM-dependent methyltransferase n=1 Tax=Paenibacillus sp. PvP094 TaxID=3156394 RepID=UPI0033942209
MNYNFSIDTATENPLSIIVNHIKPGSKVFEFGPSKGYMTAYLKEVLKCTVYCVEINSEAAQQAQVYCDHMIVGDLNDSSWYDQLAEDDFGTFDYLIYADVLEHLIDPEKVLKNSVEQLLNDKGEVCISIPHVGHTAVILELLDGKFGYRDTGLLDQTHLRFFTRSNLELLLKNVGLLPSKWNMVVMHPEQTEMKRSYDEVPEAVRNYLENKIDAHVYQFIVFSSKSDKEVKEVSERYSPRHAQFLQLFWDIGDGFKETQSSRHPINVKDKYFTYKIEFQAENLCSLRFDPTNFPSFIHLKRVVLKGITEGNNDLVQSGNLISTIRPYNKVEFSCDDLGAHILALNEDPQLLIPVDDVYIEPFKNYILEIEMEVTSKLDSGLILRLLKSNEELSRREAVYLDAIQRNKEILNRLNVVDEMFLSLSADKQQLENKLNQFQKDYEQEIIEKDKVISNILSSFSWRITSPLRKFRRRK